ncbi:hypothetical protein B0T16DRAFT_395621 [Cercophora newfieldiana]|uniref:Uncharacterized protein n=1 Tax=Cercophora newfieldiana TaxID=92897 RepID=A0AA39YNA7_9PEZI|nr:hypothetical protein B0T16DRAFT_395621 [Cercophora newfieldiana]
MANMASQIAMERWLPNVPAGESPLGKYGAIDPNRTRSSKRCSSTPSLIYNERVHHESLFSDGLDDGGSENDGVPGLDVDGDPGPPDLDNLEEDDGSFPSPSPSPPASQSHFAKFKSEHFTPDDTASFDSEFARLASSQEWIPGSREYTRNRTIALCEELHNHYFSQPSVPTIKEEPEGFCDSDNPVPSEQEATEIRRNGYQALCREVGIDPPPQNIGDCKNRLKNTLVNIVDLIDAQRTGKRVEVWEDFAEFCEYTKKPEHRISKQDVKGTELASLLQRLSGSGPGVNLKRGGRGKGARVIEGKSGKVKSGRVAKRH